LLEKAPVPAENIFRIPAELPDPALAADQYAATLREFFLSDPEATLGDPSRYVPRFDLVFLGMGPDGHTASLFPGTDALYVNDRIVVANYVPKFNAHRITFAAMLINNARNVTFVAAGADKAEALRGVLEGS